MTHPVFHSVFAQSWPQLPHVMQQHYALRAGSDDEIYVRGHLDIRASCMVRLLSRLTGMLVPFEGRQVPVDVRFHTAGKQAERFCLDRRFHFPNGRTIHFRSVMQPLENGEVIEWMRYGLGWKCVFVWDGAKVILQHRGYVWSVCGISIPVPLHWVLGKGYAEETPLTDTRFSMWTHTVHPLFGETFRYGGEFEITEVRCAQS